MKTYLERVMYGLCNDEPDTPEIDFYWDKLFEFVAEHADAKYDKDSLSNAFHLNIAGPFYSAVKFHGFKQGATHTMKFAAECFTIPGVTRSEAQDDYRRWGNETVELAELPQEEAEAAQG